jgi:4-amino-4-deoxy-L-arabinose transferase-like glycosyltransferase
MKYLIFGFSIKFFRRKLSLCKSSIVVAVLFSVLLIYILFFRLETVPPLWWDEGWTLQVARNWVEHGHYGRSIAGEPTSYRLAASFYAIAPIALSFELFGVGIWQGRLPALLLTFAALVLIIFLASRLYNRKIVAGTLFVLMLMPTTNELHSLYLGRQVISEMPTLFYLLAGYSCLYLALRRSIWWLLFAVIFLGVAFRIKAQMPPFILASLLFPMSIALLKRWWRPAVMLGLVLIGSWITYNGLTWLQGLILIGRTVPGEAIPGAYGVMAFVPHWNVRRLSLLFAFTLGLPSLLSLLYVTRKSYTALFRANMDIDISQEILRLVLIGFAGSWFAWYIFMGAYWGRYIFPVVFVSSIFVAAWLYHITSGYDLRYVIKHSSDVLLLRKIDKSSLGALFSLLVVAVMVPLTIYTLVGSILLPKPPSAAEVAAYLDQHVPEDAIIESYESELFFLSNLKFHFPPDRVHVELIYRSQIDPSASVDYDPLLANPDYLVVGHHNIKHRLYDEILASGEFYLVKEIDYYRVYERIR